MSPTGDPIFFFREFEEPYGFLSQWYRSPFTAPAPPSAGPGAPEMRFVTTEQYMMYHKAIIFNDQEAANKIMLESKPRKHKALGRTVKDFDHKKWDEKKDQLVEDGNWWKFSRPLEGDLGKMLLQTGNRELVEASPFDRIWGVGYGVTTAEANRGA